MRPMTPAQSAVRAALEQPMLSETKCRAVVLAVLRAVREPSGGMLEDAAITDVPWEYADATTGETVVGPFALDFSGANKIERAAEVAGAIHRAMIDALIAQEGG